MEFNNLTTETISHLRTLKQQSTRGRNLTNLEIQYINCVNNFMKMNNFEPPKKTIYIERGNRNGYIEYSGKTSWWVKPDDKWTEIPDSI